MQFTLARLTWKQQAGVGLGVSAVVIACCHVFWLAPARIGIAAQRRTLAVLRNDVARAGMTERTLSDLQQLHAALRLRLATLQAAAARDDEVPQILRGAQAIAEDSGLWITGFKPAAAVARQDGTERSVTVEFEGTYAALEAFLAGLSEHPRLVVVSALRLRALAQPSDVTTLTGSCRLTTFVPGGIQPAPAGGAAPPGRRGDQGAPGTTAVERGLATTDGESAEALP